MTFEQRFKSVDEFLNHTDTMMKEIDDPFIQQRYLGFITVSAVTVYELAIKDIIFRFSDQKHKVLGSLSRSFFDKMNGRIKLDDLRRTHLPRFGAKYAIKFDSILDQKEENSLKAKEGSIKTSYGNVIVWRNEFAHKGITPTTTNYWEVRNSYVLGKRVIYCLDEALIR